MTAQEILKIVKADLKAASIVKAERDKSIEKRIKEYNGEPYGNERKGRSQIVSRDIKRQDEWLHAMLKEPFVSSPDIVKCNPVTWEDRLAARQAELILNTMFCRQFNRYNFMTKLLKVLTVEGTVVIQTGWEYEDEEVEVEEAITTIDPLTMQEIQVDTVKKIERKIIVNRPTAKICRNQDIFIDPTCQDDLDNAQFVIYRYETDLSTLRKDGRYINLDKIYKNNDKIESYDFDFGIDENKEFKFTDEPRKKIVVYEYWGNIDRDGDGIAEPIVCAWVNDVIIRLEDNPFPDKKIPFILLTYNPIPFNLYGESNGDLISDNQKVKTAMLRGIIDNMALSNNAQKGIPKGWLDDQNMKRMLSGNNYEYNPGVGQIIEGTYNSIPASVFETIMLMNNDIESITGVKSFSQGITSNSLGNTATGVRGVLDATAVRRLNIIRNIAENGIKPLMRKWLAYCNEFLEPTQVVRITNDRFIEIKRDDLAGNIDIDITISTNEDNNIKAQELAFLMQTIGQSMDHGMRTILMAEIARLHKMPDLAKRLEEYQPEPDPFAIKARELELAKLEAEIYNEKAKAMENSVDVELKKAKIQSELARAALDKEEADLKSLTFLERESGEDFRKEIIKNEYKAKNDILKERIKSLAKRAKGFDYE